MSKIFYLECAVIVDDDVNVQALTNQFRQHHAVSVKSQGFLGSLKATSPEMIRARRILEAASRPEADAYRQAEKELAALPDEVDFETIDDLT